jgi:hemoglobin
MNRQINIYEFAGGDEPFRRMINAFYEGIESDPIVRPMYPEDLTDSIEHMFLFVTQYFGAPPRYNELRGHPRLRMRHNPFPIDQAARDAWMKHMRNAIVQTGFDPVVEQMLLEYFENTATFLMNKFDANSITLQG